MDTTATAHPLLDSSMNAPWGMLAAIDLNGCDRHRLADPDSIRRFVPTVIVAIGMRARGPLRLERFGDGVLEGWSAMQFIETSSITVHADEVFGRCFVDGDGMVAVFGTPVAHEDDAQRATETAAALMSRLAVLAAALERDHGIELVTRAGISAGTALTPAGARPGALPLGEVVADSARLARDAAPGRVAIDGRTRALLDVQPAEAGADAPLVGRERELRLLLDAFDRAAEQRDPQVATIVGEPGIGKSRLARELISRLGARANVLEGRCLPYGESITYWPVREMILKAARGRPLEALTAAMEAGRRSRRQSEPPSAWTRELLVKRPRGPSGDCSPRSRATAR